MYNVGLGKFREDLEQGRCEEGGGQWAGGLRSPFYIFFLKYHAVSFFFSKNYTKITLPQTLEHYAQMHLLTLIWLDNFF